MSLSSTNNKQSISIDTKDLPLNTIQPLICCPLYNSNTNQYIGYKLSYDSSSKSPLIRNVLKTLKTPITPMACNNIKRYIFDGDGLPLELGWIDRPAIIIERYDIDISLQAVAYKEHTSNPMEYKTITYVKDNTIHNNTSYNTLHRAVCHGEVKYHTLQGIFTVQYSMGLPLSMHYHHLKQNIDITYKHVIIDSINTAVISRISYSGFIPNEEWNIYCINTYNIDNYQFNGEQSMRWNNQPLDEPGIISVNVKDNYVVNYKTCNSKGYLQPRVHKFTSIDDFRDSVYTMFSEHFRSLGSKIPDFKNLPDAKLYTENYHNKINLLGILPKAKFESTLRGQLYYYDELLNTMTSSLFFDNKGIRNGPMRRNGYNFVYYYYGEIVTKESYISSLLSDSLPPTQLQIVTGSFKIPSILSLIWSYTKSYSNQELLQYLRTICDISQTTNTESDSVDQIIKLLGDIAD